MTLSPEEQAEVDELFAEMDDLQEDVAELEKKEIKNEKKVIKKRKLDPNEKLFPPLGPKEKKKVRVRYVTDPAELIDYPLPDEGNPQTIGSVFMIFDEKTGDPKIVNNSEVILKQGNIIVNPVDSQIPMFDIHPLNPKPIKKANHK